LLQSSNQLYGTSANALVAIHLWDIRYNNSGFPVFVKLFILFLLKSSGKPVFLFNAIRIFK
jgi:hypothetical protein